MENVKYKLSIKSKFMRMSQDLANSIAKQMTVKKDALYAKLDADFQKFVTKHYVAQVPATIKRAFKKCPDWFQTTDYIVINGHGFNWVNVRVVGKDVIEQHNGKAFLSLTPELIKKVNELVKERDKVKEESKIMKQEIRTALLNLRTFSNIQQHLPEAVKYIPKSQSREIMVDLTKLRTKLKVA